MSDPEADKKRAKAAVQALFDRYQILAAQRPADHVDYDRDTVNSLKLIDAGPDGSVVFELYITPNYSNLNNVMHGGAAGVIFDMTTTAALCPLSRPGAWEFLGGVSRTLNISYLKPVPLRTTVRINAKVVSAGKQMTLIRGEMTSLDGKITYCTAEHHKVNVPVQGHHLKARIPWDEEFDREWKKKDASVPRSKL